ncbi:MAG: phosphoribosylglycinamide formyltransferase [Armatimonadetes bacterium]|nr:phosphoribosylglycinamide formyltransferase [Armatimonadota bacterium]
MTALLNACKSGRISASGSLVIAPSENIPAVGNAHDLRADIAIIHPSDPHFGEDLLAILDAERIDLLCLAGYMRLLPKDVVRDFEGRILNIHPALLPKYGGKGMYGMRVHQAVIDAGEKESGCSVHYLTEKYDEGEVLLQMKCPVHPDDTAETLAARVLELEHECYIGAVRKWIRQHIYAGRNASL